LRTTVAIPCYNEATTIAKVVSDFRKELPEAEILVVDNASSDDSGARAAAAGARVVREKRRGKGYVMQTILETVDADVCVIVDGDDTYFAEDVHQLLLPVTSDQADMVVGDRLKEATSVALNDLHRFGNRAILAIINMAFRTDFQDVLSGYRVMNRKFMNAVPLIAGGFETETELTLQALEKGMVIREMPIRYRARPVGSVSKLSPFADGYRILITMAVLLRNHRPLYFFSSIAVGLLIADGVYAAALLAGRLPPYGRLVHGGVMGGIALLASGLVLIGILLNAVSAGFQELTALQRARVFPVGQLHAAAQRNQHGRRQRGAVEYAASAIADHDPHHRLRGAPITIGAPFQPPAVHQTLAVNAHVHRHCRDAGMLARRAPRVRKIGRNIADEGLRIDEVSPNIVVRGRFGVVLSSG